MRRKSRGVFLSKNKTKTLYLPVHWMPKSGPGAVIILKGISSRLRWNWTSDAHSAWQQIYTALRATPRSSDFALGFKVLLRAHFVTYLSRMGGLQGRYDDLSQVVFNLSRVVFNLNRSIGDTNIAPDTMTKDSKLRTRIECLKDIKVTKITKVQKRVVWFGQFPIRITKTNT